jgi:hypothetical protein
MTYCLSYLSSYSTLLSPTFKKYYLYSTQLIMIWKLSKLSSLSISLTHCPRVAYHIF